MSSMFSSCLDLIFLSRILLMQLYCEYWDSHDDDDDRTLSFVNSLLEKKKKRSSLVNSVKAQPKTVHTHVQFSLTNAIDRSSFSSHIFWCCSYVVYSLLDQSTPLINLKTTEDFFLYSNVFVLRHAMITSISTHLLRSSSFFSSI